MHRFSTILTSLLLSCLFCSCKDDAAEDATAELIQTQSAELKKLTKELDQLRDAYAGALANQAEAESQADAARKEAAGAQIEKLGLEEALEKQSQRLEEVNGEIEKTHQRHQEQLESLKKEFEDYQRRYRISLREKAPGTKLEQVHYRDRKFSDVTVESASPGGIEISHSDGVAHLEFAYLSPEIRNQFGYNKAESEAHRHQSQISEREQIAEQHARKVALEAERLARHQRIAYATWTKEIDRAQDQIDHLYQKIEGLEKQLARTNPGSATVSRIHSEIARIQREINSRERVLRERKLDPPPNPDAAIAKAAETEAPSPGSTDAPSQQTTTDPFSEDTSSPAEEQPLPASVAEFLRQLEEEED